MKSISSSATKIVLIMFALTTCAGFLLGKIDAAIFVPLVASVLGAYYGDKSRKTNENTDIAQS